MNLEMGKRLVTEIKSKNQNTFTFTEHLEDLRRLLLRCLGILLLSSTVCFIYVKKIVHILKIPSYNLIENFVFLKPTEIITVYVKTSIFAGLVLASPVIFFLVWKFIEPAIEQKVSILFWFLSGSVLFMAGTLFSYKIVVPTALSFLMKISSEIATPMINFNFYISFLLSIMLIGGIIFEMPIVSAILSKIGILSPQLMKSKRKEAIFALIVIAAVITPTTDIFNMMLFVVPMVILYEISILVSSIFAKPYSLKYNSGDYSS